MRLIANIESGLAGIRCLSEHFEDVTRQVDCRPCAARSGDTACAVSLLAAPPTPPSRPSPRGSGEPRMSSTKSSPKRTTCDAADRETAWSDRSRVPFELEAARQHRVSSPSAATRGGPPVLHVGKQPPWPLLVERKHQDPWGQSSRHRPLNVQTSTSNARSPFRRKTVSPFDPTDFGASQQLEIGGETVLARSGTPHVEQHEGRFF